MSSKAKKEILYEDFEPAFNWVREEESDTLVVLLSGFRRDEMKVQIATNRILKVSGEQKMEDKKSVRRRFYREFSVPRDININLISARFEDGKLYIKLPKTVMKKKEEEDSNNNKKQVWKWVGFIVALLMLVLVIGIGIRNNAMQDYSSSLGTSDDIQQLLFDV
ncbi:inactive protein RESTRICTED TEV MOVEMENT 2-like [Neltuma alba]|uniref:inactive protein RESTRICTED TEV MOVEMENT 2-like n=1 Tax=Neltuma alba TaxID=207710 RepID=UPI0010A523C8|nr:inactive protein RESTRICTED TEV MOVEMENT 2-like [Prosopis alba]